jgi:hypothetical protein
MKYKELIEAHGLTLHGDIEHFAELIAAQEREACCAIVYGFCESDNVAQRTVDAIRARGTT